VLRIIILELLFEAIYLGWRGLLHFLPFSLETVITLNAFSIVFFLILITLVQNIFLIYITLRWINDYYEIRTDEIAHITGILSKTEKAYPYRDIQSITIHQGFLGRLFHYGSVHLYIPTLGHDLHFTEVSDPARFVDLVKRANPQIEGGQYIFRR
jgi:membrane protein YdbS with pleckstrin-like domain